MQKTNNSFSLEKNKKILAACDPACLSDSAHEGLRSDTYEIREAKREGFTLFALHETPYALYSNYNPMQDVRKYFDTLTLPENHIAVFLGFGLGYHLQEYGARSTEKQQIIIIEPDIALMTFLCKNYDLSFLSARENKHCLFGRSIDDSIRHLRDAYTKAARVNAHQPLTFIPITGEPLMRAHQTYFERILAFLNVQNTRLERTHAIRKEQNRVTSLLPNNQAALEAQVSSLRHDPDFSLATLSSTDIMSLLLYQTITSKDFAEYDG